jgi:anti-sigma regulatory factor (Ser/Thr protein kinase)
MRPLQVRTEVPNGSAAPAAARTFVRSAADRLPGPLLDDACLLVSEMVTNSYKHAGNPEGFPIEVVLDLSEERLRLEVIDHSIFDPTPESTGELRDVKWGLSLVDKIADKWGRISKGGVWAEFRTLPG